MELESKNNIIPPIETSKMSAFINAEQGDSSELPINHTIENECNTKDEIFEPVNENEIKEETYQDILGSGDLLKKIIKHGISDDRPMKGEQILINLVGRLEEKDDIIEEEKNLEITLGDCEVKYSFFINI
jgi:FK506-binding protein 8